MQSGKVSQTLLVIINEHKWGHFWKGCETVVTNLSLSISGAPALILCLSHSSLLAMTDGRSCPERPVSFSSWSINVVAGRPLERLPYNFKICTMLRRSEKLTMYCVYFFLTITRHLSGNFALCVSLKLSYLVLISI